MKSIFLLLPILFLIGSCNNFRDSTQYKTGIAEVNGTKLYYELAGAGECIVFIHGNISDSRQWDDQLNFFKREYQVLRYDVRGYGQSAIPVEGEKYRDHGDLKALLDYLGIEKVHVAGFSMGSGIAINFALEYPQMTNSLIPIGPYVCGYYSPAVDSLLSDFGRIPTIINEKGLKGAAEEHVQFQFLKSHMMSPEAKERIIEIGYDYTFWHFLNPEQIRIEPDAVNLLDNIKIPTLIITSQYDMQVCLEVADLLKERIPHSLKVDIDDATHYMFMDKPEEFNSLLSSFLAELY